MKKYISIILVAFTFASCATSTATVSNTSGIAEQTARDITNKMKSTLLLDKTQEDKVMLINVTNQKILNKLSSSQNSELIKNTKEQYKTEIQSVLNNEQFSRFLTDFKDLL